MYPENGDFLVRRPACDPRKPRITLFFSLLSGKTRVETGSHADACATTLGMWSKKFLVSGRFDGEYGVVSLPAQSLRSLISSKLLRLRGVSLTIENTFPGSSRLFTQRPIRILYSQCRLDKKSRGRDRFASCVVSKSSDEPVS